MPGTRVTRTILRWLGIESFIRRRNSNHGSHLGRIRWVVERTISWFLGLRRMQIRDDRHSTIIDAWEHLALAVICYQILTSNTSSEIEKGGSLPASKLDFCSFREFELVFQ